MNASRLTSRRFNNVLLTIVAIAAISSFVGVRARDVIDALTSLTRVDNLQITSLVGVGTVPDANATMTFSQSYGEKISLYPLSSTAFVGFAVFDANANQKILRMTGDPDGTPDNRIMEIGYGDNAAFTRAIDIYGDGSMESDNSMWILNGTDGTIFSDGSCQFGGDNTDRLQVWGHVSTRGTAPTASSCGGSPTVVGNDIAFKATVGTAITACTWTFSRTYTDIPVCVDFVEGGVALPTCTISATAITCTLTVASSVHNWFCTGNQSGST